MLRKNKLSRLGFVGIALALILFTACQTNSEKMNPFLITPQSVGGLTQQTEVRALDSIYAQDSIVQKNHTKGFMSETEYIIYDKTGGKMLVLNPIVTFDSTSTMAGVQIKDPRFHTAEGLSLKSTFKTISKHYKISRIENTLSNAIIFLDEMNIYLAIDKKHIAGDAQFDPSAKIYPTQIPENAPIKYLWIGWQ